MMKNFRTFILAAFACAFAATAALAHAFLDHAVPGVGATVSASPGELELSFTQNIVPAFSGVEIAEAGGGSVPVGKPVVDPGSPNVIHVRLGRALKPGVYTVRWHVVSVDTHPTHGDFTFGVGP